MTMSACPLSMSSTPYAMATAPAAHAFDCTVRGRCIRTARRCNPRPSGGGTDGGGWHPRFATPSRATGGGRSHRNAPRPGTSRTRCRPAPARNHLPRNPHWQWPLRTRPQPWRGNGRPCPFPRGGARQTSRRLLPATHREFRDEPGGIDGRHPGDTGRTRPDGGPAVLRADADRRKQPDPGDSNIRGDHPIDSVQETGWTAGRDTVRMESPPTDSSSPGTSKGTSSRARA